MQDEPDFQTLAALWLARNPRSEELDETTRSAVVKRLAQALEARRASIGQIDHEADLVVNVDRGHFTAGERLPEDAVEQLTRFVQERIDQTTELQ
jgi:hypothetical protein